MNATTKNMIEIASALGRRGFAVACLEVRTPDGRTWSVDAASTGGFRLFEIDPDGRRGPDEHDAVDGDTWFASDLVDFIVLQAPSGSIVPGSPVRDGGVHP